MRGSVRTVTPVMTTVRAMEPSWVLLLVIGLIGGLGLFLYGMNLAGDHLQKAAGNQMRDLIRKLTRNRWTALLVGTVASAVLQSSSAATVMLVGFVSATMMTLTQAIGVTMGTKIGVTITVQLIAFNISKYALAIVGAGALTIMAAGRKEKVKHIGSILLGFGLIFFGLSVMSGSMKPLRGMPEFASMLLDFSKSPGLAIIVGLLFTSIIQSAAATVGMCMALAAQGLLPLSAAIPLSIGAAIGTCTTALLASFGATRDGKRVAVAHLIFSVLAALIFYPFISIFVDFTVQFTRWIGSTSPIREIANGFMLFSIISALVFIPFVAQLEKLVRIIIPEKTEEKPFGPRYINDAGLKVGLMALDQAQKEVEHMAQLLGDMLKNTWPAIVNRDQEQIKSLSAEDDKLDILEKTIRPFLSKVAQRGLSNQDTALERTLIYITEDLKAAGDVLAKEVLFSADKMAGSKSHLSPQGLKELEEFHQKIVKKLDRVLMAITQQDRQIAEQVLQLRFKERQLARRLRGTHLERMQTGEDKNLESGSEHLNILAGLRAVGNKLDNVAEEIIREM